MNACDDNRASFSSGPGNRAIILGAFTATAPACCLFQAVTHLFLVPLFLGLIGICLGITATTDRRSVLNVDWIAFAFC